jgi:hypothetical protein
METAYRGGFDLEQIDLTKKIEEELSRIAE